MAQSEQSALTDASACTERTHQHIFHILPLIEKNLKLSKTCSERQGSFLLIWNIIYIIYMDFIDFKLNIEYFLKNEIQKLSQQCIFISHDLC